MSNAEADAETFKRIKFVMGSILIYNERPHDRNSTRIFLNEIYAQLESCPGFQDYLNDLDAEEYERPEREWNPPCVACGRVVPPGMQHRCPGVPND